MFECFFPISHFFVSFPSKVDPKRMTSEFVAEATVASWHVLGYLLILGLYGCHTKTYKCSLSPLPLYCLSGCELSELTG